jgi:hypothetical protein
MNRTLTSPDVVASRQLQSTRLFISFILRKAPTSLDRGDISGDLTDFFSINGPLRAVKGTEDRNESHFDFNQRCFKPEVTMNKGFHRFYVTWKHPRRWIEVIFLVT